MTHAELVARAAAWLRGSQKCTVVMTETGCWQTQIPDAIGWDWRGRSTVVECKTSVSDFYADRRKRMPAVGRKKFYLTPQGLLTGKALPDGCGLLEVRGNRVKVVTQAEWHWKYRGEWEVPLLVAELRRVAAGVSRPRLIVDEADVLALAAGSP